MNQQIPLGTQMILMFFALVGVAQLALALKALIIELREGLATSFKRTIVLSITTGLMIAVAFFAFVKKPSISLKQSNILKPISHETDTGEIPQEDKKNREFFALYDNLRNEVNVFNTTFIKIQREVERMKTATQTNNETPTLNELINKLNSTMENIVNELRSYSRNFDESVQGSIPNSVNKGFSIEIDSNLLLTIDAILLLIGTAGLFLLGDPHNLVNNEWLRFFTRNAKNRSDDHQIAIEKLNRLAGLVDKEQYEAGLRIAEGINKRKLKMLDRMDFYYLKSFSAVKILMADWLIGAPESASLSTERKKSLLSEVCENLGELLIEAPRMAEAQYLMGVALIIKEECEKALGFFNQAQNRLKQEEADFKHFKSYCLLKLAADLLTKADIEGANKLFDEVISLEVLKDRIPGILVENRLLNIMDSYRERKFEDARRGLETISQVEGLSPGQKKSIDIITESLEIMFLFTEKRLEETIRNTDVFLVKRTPEDLPEPDDQAADEFMFRVVNEDKLPFPAPIFRTFYFLQAVVMLQLTEMKNLTLNTGEAEKLARPLLRALQFEPRHRDILACLGALYFWFLPHKKEKALEWLEASDNMGVESDYIHSLLEKYRSIEVERKRILDRFMTLSARFLADGSVNADIKHELAQELGQFHEFRPILIELGDIGEIQQKSPTIKTLLNRAEYLYRFSTDISQSEAIAEKNKIISITREYGGVVKTIEASANRLEAIEKEIINVIAHQVIK
jgi:tetratricopeptide (TPR) repeat protein